MATARKIAGGSAYVPIHLPLPEYFVWAWKRNKAQRELSRTNRHKFRSEMWEFVRYMAAHPQLRGLEASEAFRLLSAVEVPQTKRPMSWFEYFPESDDPALEFLTTWASVRVPAGDDILDLAVQVARERPLKLQNPISETYARFVSIAAHLQELRPPGEYINLPVSRLGKILKVEPRTVSCYSKQAKIDGYLILTEKSHPLSHQAARYKFFLERFDMQTGEELQKNPQFHKDCKDSKDIKDLEESNDQRETNRSSEELERLEGVIGIRTDIERNEGKTRVAFSMQNQRMNPAERRKLLQAQAALAQEKFGPSGSVA